MEMTTKSSGVTLLALVASAVVGCGLNLHAQSVPTITVQPVSQTVQPGANVTFSVAVDGTGPFSYQWQFNGTNLPNNIISTVAGMGPTGYSADGVPATTSGLNVPSGVVLDAGGNLYIADTSNYRVRKVDTNGVISTVAGTGGFGYSGDGEAATNATLNLPSGVALDAVGNLYIADYYNHRIRKVDTNGIITTVAGVSTAGYSGDGGAATNASLNSPSAVALDAAGNVFIADANNHRIRKVDTNGIITTVAGGSAAGYSGDGGAATNASLNSPSGLALDAAGNLYIADANNHRIREVDLNGIITTVAGNGSGSYAGDGGAATNASLYAPHGVALDGAGSLFIADSSNNRIRKVDLVGIITTVAGNGSGNSSGDGRTATNASVYFPKGLTLDGAGSLYIADTYNHRIRKVHFPIEPPLTITNTGATNAGTYSVVVSSPYGSVTSVVATLTVEAPGAITTQPASQMALIGSSPILSVGVAGSGPFGYVWYFASTNLVQSGTNATLTLTGFAPSQAGDYTVVVTNAYGSVTSQVATLTAVFPPSITAQPTSQTILPGSNTSFSVAAGGTGPFTYRWQFNGNVLPGGLISTVAGDGTTTYRGDGWLSTYTGLLAPKGVAIDAVGNLYIADTGNQRVRKVDTNGFISTVAGNGTYGYSGDGGPATNASLRNPQGVGFDAAGNLYIADTSNARIRKVDTHGTITTVAGNGTYGYSGDGGPATNTSLNNPKGVASDSAGNLYIADTGNYRIRRVDVAGIITTVAGKSAAGYSGDGGAATNASLNAPSGVALDSAGNLYMADTGNNRIRKVDVAGIITTVAGKSMAGYSGDGGAPTNANLNGPSGVALDPAGNLYMADTGNNRIRKVDVAGIITTAAGKSTAGYSGDGGAATNASLNSPVSVAFDPLGNLYIADGNNYRIRKVLPSTTSPTFTLASATPRNAGDYTVVVTGPYGSVTSVVATLVVQAPGVIVRQPASQTTALGSSPVFSVSVAGSGPFEYLWFRDGNNLVQDSASCRLTLPPVSVDDAGSYTVVITNAYGSVTSQVAALTIAFPPSVAPQPASQAVLAGSNVSFSVTAGGVGPFSYQWRLNGTNLPNNLISTVAGNGSGTYGGDGGPATNASLHYPQGVGFDATGSLYIADNNNDRVRKVDANGFVCTVAGDGYGAGSGSGRYAGDGGVATNASLYRPNNVAWDAAGNLYVADIFNHCIRRVDTNGIITTAAGTGVASYSGDGGSAVVARFAYPASVAFDTLGNLFIADLGNNRIRKVAPNGIITTVAGKGGSGYSGDGGAATNAQLYNPQGACVDAAGNLYIADTGNSCIRKVDTNGIITTVAGTGALGSSGDGGAATNATFRSPWYVALDVAGNLYIADCGACLIRKVDTNGIITTVAGNGRNAYAGDGGAATNASLSRPACVAFDPVGNLYIADWYNNRVRKVHLTGDPTYALNNVGADNAGDYTVVITSPYGSVTSAVATLTVTVPRTPPQFLTSDGVFGLQTNSQFGFNISGSVGQTIVVDGSTDLVEWVPLLTNTVVTTPFYFFDPVWTNFPARFYRARLP